MNAIRFTTNAGKIRLCYRFAAVVAIGVVLCIDAPAFPQGGEGNSNTIIRRLNPDQFKDLPVRIVKVLQQRGCTIPQVYDASQRWNVIQGEFAKRGQKDWVVLCSLNGTSSILVFWGGPAQACPSEIAPAEDEDFLQDIGDGRMGFSRVLSAASKRIILYHYKTYGGPQPPPIDHDGIDDMFMDKGSEVHYCYEGKWLKLQGSD